MCQLGCLFFTADSRTKVSNIKQEEASGKTPKGEPQESIGNKKSPSTDYVPPAPPQSRCRKCGRPSWAKSSDSSTCKTCTLKARASGTRAASSGRPAGRLLKTAGVAASTSAALEVHLQRTGHWSDAEVHKSIRKLFPQEWLAE